MLSNPNSLSTSVSQKGSPRVDKCAENASSAHGNDEETLGCLGRDCSQAVVSMWWRSGTGALPPCFCVKDVRLPLGFLFRGWASSTLTRSRPLFHGVHCFVEGQGCGDVPLWRTDGWVWFLSPEPGIISITHLSKLPPPFLMWPLLQLVGAGLLVFRG